MTAEPLIDVELAAFLQSGISMHLATARESVPQLTRVAACRVSANRRSVTVYVVAAQSGAVLDDVRANGAVAAVFTKPCSHRTVQLKGGDARVDPASAADLDFVRAQVAAFGAEIASMGFPRDLGRTLALGASEELAAVTFTATSAFEQTPGPAAGTVLKGT